MIARFPKKWITVAGLLGVLLPYSPTAGWSYEEITVTSGGTITGKVFLKGTPPPARIFHMIESPNIEYCGRVSDGKGNRLLKEFQVAEDGGFQDVVVAVVGVEKGKKFDFTPEIKAENCRLSPFVTAVRNLHRIKLINKDPISHDIQAYTLKDNYTFAMYNQPLQPKITTAQEIRLRKTHYLFRTQCGIHAFMQSWGIAVGNPYFAVTAKDGSFSIPDLPPGTYDVIAWHPHMQVQSQKVTVPPHGEATIAFNFDASVVSIPLHDLQTGYRFDTVLKSTRPIQAIVERQER
jgi:Carboxypeptidase regulatory-like domain